MAFKVIKSSTKNRDIIVSDQTDIKVSVFDLAIDRFKEKTGIVAFYGNDAGNWLAFEVEDDEQLEAADAIQWYAHEVIKNPLMPLTDKDPRPMVN